MVRLLRRFRRKLCREIIRLFRLFFVVVLLVSSFSFESRAEVVAPIYDMSDIYQINMAEPAKDSNNGYLTLLVENSAGTRFVLVYFWHQNNADSTLPQMNITLAANELQFICSGVYTTLMCISSDGRDSASLLISGSPNLYTNSLNNLTVLGYNIYGNYGTLEGFSTINGYADEWDVLFVGDYLEIDLLAKIYRCVDATMSIDSYIMQDLNDILSSCETIKDYISSCVTYLNSISVELVDIGISLDEINAKYDELITIQTNTYSLLNKMNTNLSTVINIIRGIATSTGNILNYIKRIAGEENSTNIEDVQFGKEMQDKSDALNDLNEQNNTEQIDVESASDDVDSNIDFDSMAEFGGVLATVSSNEYVIPFFMVVFSVALVSYVLFGKR